MLQQTRGVYVTVGDNGFRYLQPRPANSIASAGEQMRVGDTVAVQSAALHRLSDLSQEAFINSLNEWTTRGVIQILALLFVLVPLAMLLHQGANAQTLLGATGIAVVIMLIARSIEMHRRRFLLAYDLPEPYVRRYEKLCRALQDLGASGAFRGIRSMHRHGDWKHNAGAMTDFFLERAFLRPGGLPYVLSNVQPVTLNTQGKEICFLPDRILFRQDGRFAAISYQSLKLDRHTGIFVWNERVPADTEVIGYSWRFPRKNGGRDRRFNGNVQIPNVRVAYLAIESGTGLVLLLQATDLAAVQRAHDAILDYCQALAPTRDVQEAVAPAELRQALSIMGLASLQTIEILQATLLAIHERNEPKRLALMPPDMASFVSERMQEVEAAHALLKTDAMIRTASVTSTTQEQAGEGPECSKISKTAPRSGRRQPTGLPLRATMMTALMAGLVFYTWSAWPPTEVPPPTRAEVATSPSISGGAPAAQYRRENLNVGSYGQTIQKAHPSRSLHPLVLRLPLPRILSMSISIRP